MGWAPLWRWGGFLGEEVGSRMPCFLAEGGGTWHSLGTSWLTHTRPPRPLLAGCPGAGTLLLQPPATQCVQAGPCRGARVLTRCIAPVALRAAHHGHQPRPGPVPVSRVWGEGPGLPPAGVPGCHTTNTPGPLVPGEAGGWGAKAVEVGHRASAGGGPLHRSAPGASASSCVSWARVANASCRGH